MYTVKEVEKKTGCSAHEICYFARTHNVGKIKSNGKHVYVFNGQEFRLFLIYKNKRKPKKNPTGQLVFPFFQKQAKICRSLKEKKKEGQGKKLVEALKKAGDKGVSRKRIKILLKLKKDEELENVLLKVSHLPIADDETIDDRVYWIG